MADAQGLASGPNGATEEEIALRDAVRRIEVDRKDRYAIHVHLSQLRQQYRLPHYMRIASRAFDPLILNHDATLYTLSNFDMVLLCRGVPVESIDAPLAKMRTLFGEDPLTFGDVGSLDDRFTTWYDLSLPSDFETFNALVNELGAAVEDRLRKAAELGEGPNRTMLGDPLDAGHLAKIGVKIQQVPLEELVHRQTAVEIHPGGRGDMLFVEHYVSIIDLQKRVAPNINLFGNPWLFQYLTQTLDRRLLARIAVSDPASWTAPVSINLNIATVLSPGFQNFHDKMRGSADKIVVELQTLDIFADINSFVAARGWLQGHGYRVLIDGLNPLSLQFFDPSHLRGDFIKIAWSSEFLGGVQEERLMEMQDIVQHAGKDAIILSRVDSEDAVKWAVTLGIRRFQGRFVDRIVAKMAEKGLL